MPSPSGCWEIFLGSPTAPAHPTSHHVYLSLFLADQGMKNPSSVTPGQGIGQIPGSPGQSHPILTRWILPVRPLVAAEMNPVHPAGPGEADGLGAR